MAEANAKLNASCCDGTMTDRGCIVSKQTDGEGASDKVAHKNNLLPNGCLKHSLEENGRVRLLESSEDKDVTVCENNSGDVHASDDSPCNAKCECEHVSNSTADCAVNDTVCANNKVPGQNGEHGPDLPGEGSCLETCTQGVAKISIAESCPSQESVPETESSSSSSCGPDVVGDLEYVVYESELQMPDIMRLITKDLSEPYSIYTYRYFIHNWPRLCFLVRLISLCYIIRILMHVGYNNSTTIIETDVILLCIDALM